MTTSRKINRRRRNQKKSRRNRRSRNKKVKISNNINKLFLGGLIQTSNLFDGNYTNNILLIIDPQNDFSDADGINRMEDGNLHVKGSSSDYAKIIDFINSNKDHINEIHISLDTHTDRHIGHPGFWSRKKGDRYIDADDSDGLRILTIGENGKIYGTSVLPDNILDGDERIREYIPRKYDDMSDETYKLLNNYVIEYINFFKIKKNEKIPENFFEAIAYMEAQKIKTPIDTANDNKNKHNQLAWIWRTHCIEKTEGHKVANELKKAIDEFKKLEDKKVIYHIKGQNNLSEMYSIFSAENDIYKIYKIYDQLKPLIYTGDNNNEYSKKDGIANYEDVIKCQNTITDRNVELMERLLGTNNRIFICGQAKTHCVKSSLIDLMEYMTETKISTDRVVLLSNMTSPIPGATDDIVEITDKSKFTAFDPINRSDIPEISSM